MVNIMSIVSKVAPIAIDYLLDNIQTQNGIKVKEITHKSPSHEINLNINLNVNRGQSYAPATSQKSVTKTDRFVIGMRYDL